jgi:hypothetical protein
MYESSHIPPRERFTVAGAFFPVLGLEHLSMRLVFALALLGAVAPLFAGSRSTPDKPKSKVTKRKASGSASSASAASKSGTRAGHTAKTTSRARNGKYAVTRVSAAPTYQLHPDPERYVQIQQALADRGYFKGAADGQWGEDSVDALKRFQADQKLPDDGKLGALTLTGLGLGPKHDGSTASTVPAPPNSTESPASGLTAEPPPPAPEPPENEAMRPPA